MRHEVFLFVLFGASLCFPQANFLPPVVGGNRIDLLSPDGPFGIGTRTYHWVDRSRHEKASKDPAEFRQVVVQVWYPAKSGKEPTAPYVPQLNAYRHVWEKSEVDLAIRTRTHSHINARPVSGVPFPVVLLSHGWNGTRSEYTSLAEGLASHGYAVFGVDHPYMGRTVLANGKVTEATEDQFQDAAEIMEYYGRDLQFVIDQIAKLNAADGDNVLACRLDLSRIAAIGHSSGFSASSTACRHDHRIQACINVDAPGFKTELLAGLHQPLLWIRLERAGPVPREFLQTTTAAVYELQIKDASHGSVEDWDYLRAASSHEREVAAQRLILIRRYVEAFLEKSLQDQNSDLLRNFETKTIKLERYPAR
jgi:pimeloyl-ACP methyl ester carboxylesterase